MVEELRERLRRLEERMAQQVRLGIVTERLPLEGKVRVRLPDADNMVSAPLPVLLPTTARRKAFWLPDIDEQVLCLFLPSSGEMAGFVLGALYSAADTAPEQTTAGGELTAGVMRLGLNGENGAYIEYDPVTNRVNVDLKEGSMHVFGHLVANSWG